MVKINLMCRRSRLTLDQQKGTFGRSISCLKTKQILPMCCAHLKCKPTGYIINLRKRKHGDLTTNFPSRQTHLITHNALEERQRRNNISQVGEGSKQCSGCQPVVSLCLVQPNFYGLALPSILNCATKTELFDNALQIGGI